MIPFIIGLVIGVFIGGFIAAHTIGNITVNIPLPPEYLEMLESGDEYPDEDEYEDYDDQN